MKRVSRLTIVMTLFLIALSLEFGCSSLGSPPELRDRSLRLSRHAPTLEYQYAECVMRVLGLCTKTEMKLETWDLTDQRVRDQLIDSGFVMRVRVQP